MGGSHNGFICITVLSVPLPTTGVSTGEDRQEAGLWLSIQKLRELPLSREARLALLQDLQTSPLTGTALAPLLGDMAELRLRFCEEAYQQGAWNEALEHHDALVELVSRLVAIAPGHGPSFWARYGELLAFFTVAVHAEATPQCSDASERASRVDLAWQFSQRLSRAAALPIQPPDWLLVHEQQLVQAGMFFCSDLLAAGYTAVDLPTELLQQRAFDLAVHLQQLLDPTPEWLEERLRDLIESQVRDVLAVDRPEPRTLAALLANLEKLPQPLERREPLETAFTRARLSLELLAPELKLSVPAASVPAASVPAVAAPTMAVQIESRRSSEPDLGRASQEPTSLQQAAREPASLESVGVADLIWLEPGATASPLQLDLGPLLLAEFDQIEAALDDFCWHLPRGSRARPAAAALPLALEPRWRAGQRLEAGAFERMAYLAAAWQRRLSERLEPLPTHDWQNGLMLELSANELAVLAPLLAAPQQLDGVLSELRREHRNPEFWQRRQEVQWMECPPPLEALRRLHVEEGFYARSHEPLESLQIWGREVVQALSEAELWTDDAGCLGLWLAVAQELVISQRGALPELGMPPQPEQLLSELGGLEVVYVGDQAAAVREAHRAGRCFRGEPFGLRVMEAPESLWPDRPATGFEQSLAVLLEGVDVLYRQRPFAVLMADCGAYRLPLLRAVHQRYGVAALSSGRPMARWLVGS
ncbi:MAG: hypothetical protein WAM11_12335 [Cyanobium sp.]